MKPEKVWAKRNEYLHYCTLLSTSRNFFSNSMCSHCSMQRKSCPIAEASGFCYRASDFCSLLAQQASAVLGGNSNYRRIVINPANQKGFSG